MPELKTITYEWADGLKLTITPADWRAIWDFVVVGDEDSAAYQRCIRFIAERDKGAL